MYYKNYKNVLQNGENTEPAHYWYYNLHWPSPQYNLKPNLSTDVNQALSKF